MIRTRPHLFLGLGLVLTCALVLRCINLGFGLPAFYDPDEPLFVLKAYELLDDGTLNPRWFGHPGTTTIYLLAALDIVVVLAGLATGRFADLPAFASAVYADPGIIMLPSRFAFAIIGVAVVGMTYLVGKQLFGRVTGLLAAALLALNSLHIAWSQVIRTDIHCSLFMMLSLLFAIRSMEQYRTRDLLLAGLFAGLATATKWPGGTVLIASFGALLLARASIGDKARQALLIVSAALAGLFAGSPFVFIDWPTMVANVGGEVASGHLGHSGRGFLQNLLFYFGEVRWSMGWVGAALAIIGVFQLSRHQQARATLLPLLLLFLALICAQPQIWARWLTPVLPMLAIAAALAAVTLIRWVQLRWSGDKPRPALAAALGLAILLPSAAGALGQVRERSNDTRDQASAWARANMPAGSRVLVEHLALDLRDKPWTILFPLGQEGCIDGRKALQQGVRYDEVQQSRGKSAIIDLGSIPATSLGSCSADYAILTYYDLYRAEADDYAAQIGTYHRLIGSGRTLAMFMPERGAASGPVTRIVSLKPHTTGQ